MIKEAFLARMNIAGQLRLMRFNERHGNLVVNRNGKDYEKYFRGLTATFNYVSSHLSSKQVLDIGAGSTKGAADLALAFPLLDFQATVLTLPRETNALSHNKIKITSAETLRGIPNESVGCVLALNSIAYSRELAFVADRLNEVVVPSGIIKATFRSWRPEEKEQERINNESGFSYHDEFLEMLKTKGYDVYVWHGPFDIITAVKQPIVIGAKELLMKDFKTFDLEVGLES